MKRRTLLAGTAAAGLAGLSGCIGPLLRTVTSLESTPGAIRRDALDETDYEQVGIEEIVTEREVGAAGYAETITVTSHLTNYEKQVGIEAIAEQPTATIALFSTPKLEVAGRTLNPVADMSTREIVELVGDNYDNIDNIEEDAEETVTILDQSVTKTRFVADATFAGFDIELDLHVTEAVSRGSDLIVVLGVYPRRLRAAEAETVRELTEAVSDEPAESTDEESSANETDDQNSSDDGTADGDAGGSDGGDADSDDRSSDDDTVNVSI